jgi:hypothetical protein
VNAQPIDYVLAGNSLSARWNIRQWFLSSFMASTIAILFILVALKVSLHLSGEDENPVDETTDMKSAMFRFFVSF